MISNDQRAYHRKDRGQEAPFDNTIRHLVLKFVEYGTVGDRPHNIHQLSRRSNELNEAVSYCYRAQHFSLLPTCLNG